MITLQQWDGARWVERQVTETEVADRSAEWWAEWQRHNDASRWPDNGERNDEAVQS